MNASPKNPKTLKLTLTKQWFDLILSGAKTFEYREYKKHWIQRLLGSSGTIDYDEIQFTNGYGADKPWMRVKWAGVGIIGGKDVKPDCGEPIDTEKHYFVIALGDVVETRNLAEGDGRS